MFSFAYYKCHINQSFYFSRLEKDRELSCYECSLNSYLDFFIRNKQLYELMQKEIHIPVTKVRYVNFVFNRFNQKLEVNSNCYQYFRHYDYSGFQKNYAQFLCNKILGHRNLERKEFGFIENITQYRIQEDPNTRMYIINIFKISFLYVWLSFWHGNIKFSLLVCPNEFLHWLSLLGLI